MSPNAPAAPDPGDGHLWALLGAHAGSMLVTGDRLLLENPPAKRLLISPKRCVAGFLEG